MPFAKSNSTRIYWKVEGPADAPPLVLLNSIGTDMDLWAACLPHLRRAFNVLRIDTRGHGASDAPAGDYSLPMLAGDVAAAMDAAGMTRAAIAGVSLGGMIALQLALDDPARVAALALVCTSVTMDPAAWDARVAQVRGGGMDGIVALAMERFLSADFAVRAPATRAGVERGLRGMPVAGYAGSAAAIRDMRLHGRLTELDLPVLVVTGTQDVSTPLAGHSDYLLAGIDGARHVALRTGHLAPLEAPEALAAAIDGFLLASNMAGKTAS